ncbi:MAG: hypothetical protein CL908_07060 [Deltaproteobacteria bacterium]|nr:hypothetical protein [Deltaproteobacteria bacterium]
MSVETVFTEDQLDMLMEAFNIGVGEAASALSELANNCYEVLLSIPSARVVAVKNLAQELSIDITGDLCAVTQQYEGAIPGTAMLLYSEEESLALVRLILAEEHEIDEMSELAADALCEVGNILLNDCLAALADMLEEEIKTHLPMLLTGTCDEVLNRFSNGNLDAEILYLQMDFGLSGLDLNGFLGFSLGAESFSILREHIDLRLAALGA